MVNKRIKGISKYYSKDYNIKNSISKVWICIKPDFWYDRASVSGRAVGTQQNYIPCQQSVWA